MTETKIIEMYKKGLSLYEISKLSDYSRTKIRRILTQNGVSIRDDKKKTKKTLSKEELKYINFSTNKEYKETLERYDQSHYSLALSLLKRVRELEKEREKMKEKLEELETKNEQQQKIIKDLKQLTI